MFLVAMALLVRSDGSTKPVRDTQTALDMFMAFATVQWHAILTRDISGDHLPWEHPALEVFDPSRPVSRNCRDWKKVLLAVFDDDGLVKELPVNRMFKEVRGNMLFYWIYQSDNGLVKLNRIRGREGVMSVIAAWRDHRRSMPHLAAPMVVSFQLV